LKIVGFDTATEDTVIAARDGGEVLFQTSAGPDENGRPCHSAMLLELIERAAEALGGWSQVDRIAVGTGPGTFTGLRIGLATATGLAMSAPIEVVGVPTLKALARDLARGAPDGQLSVPMLDARRGEVFIAVYDGGGREVEPAAALAPEAAVSMLSGLDLPATVGGPGAVRFAERFERADFRIADPASQQGRLTGLAICELGAGAAPTGPDNPLEPIYIRAPDAQLWLERDSAAPG